MGIKMTLLTVLILAVATTASAIIFLRRITSWGRIIRYRAAFDVIFTIAMFAIFAGTLGGALVAALGGLFFSLSLGAANAINKAAGHIHR